jgi:hypothetical protein
VRISLETVPPGAEVYEGEVLLGVTPVVLHREANAIAELTFSLKSFEPARRKMLLQADTSLVVELAKKAAPAAPPATPAPPAAQRRPPQAAQAEELPLKEVDW